MELKKTFSLAMVYIGTVVGAGFASGLEIWTFFGRYGIFGLFGVIVMGLILSLCGAGIMLGVYNNRFNSYKQFCKVIAGEKSAFIPLFLGRFFMLASFCIMLAGSGAVFSQELGLPYFLGVVFLGVVCLIVFVCGIKALTFISCLLTPLMLLGVTMLGIYSLSYDCRSVTANLSSLLTVAGSAVSAIIYVSYNLLSVPPVIISLKAQFPSKMGTVKAGLWGGILLGIAGLFMYYSSLTEGFSAYTVPALALAHKVGDNFALFFGITIYFSILTTAISCGYGLISEIHGKFPCLSLPIVSLLVVVSACILSALGFSELVNTLYTALGYAAVLLTLLLINFSLKELKLLIKSIQK